MIILASKSPRRKEILEQLGLEFQIITADADETPTETVPSKIVEELSAKKAEAVLDKVKNELPKEDVLIIAADTLVFQGKERMGKPKNVEDAHRMLGLLQNSVHQVYTGVTLVYITNGNEKRVSFNEKTDVVFYPMTEDEIKNYVATGEPMDKAGAYAVQGISAKFIKSINGEYSNVVGLPIARLYHEINNIGFIK